MLIENRLKMNNKQIESLWMELEDVTFEENENELVLCSDWQHFSKGTSQTEIWEWFDSVYDKGVSYLANNLEYQA